MQDPLADYRRRRDFRATPEPQGDHPGPGAGEVFVVHRHEARQLHYDLRLEAGGVLCSWAVPRGFSFDPTEKRLAVRTEDHPMAYAEFAGRIPRGQYGAGTMTIWDRGTYRLVAGHDFPTALRTGELKFQLFGRRLRGEWHLVRTRATADSWLLFKARDCYAGPARDSALGIDLDRAAHGPVPLDAARMECGGGGAPFRDAAWLFELEFAGRRTLASKDDAAVALAGLATVPDNVRQGLLGLRCRAAVLDGVLVAPGADGLPRAELLAARLADPSTGPVVYYAFDLLQWEEFDLRPLPLLDRKAALRGLLGAPAGLLFVDHVAGDGDALAAAIAAAGLRGAVAKRAASSYRSGPSRDWLRIAGSGLHLPAERPAARAGAAPAPQSRVRPGNLEKVYWPAEGYTKADLLAYYQAVAAELLPHLANRPVHLNRFPDGIDGKSFYQREAKPGTPDWLRTIAIQHDGAAVPHHVIDDRDALLYAVNLGSIDLHPWLSRCGSLAEPDWAVLDLDPKTAPFAAVVRLARAAGRLLRGIGLRPLLKTSGKSGLHVYVPLARGYTYDQARLFAEAVARCLVRELPEIATVERLPHQRDGKVYVDFLQNRRGQTVVPPYSVRPVRGATVSAPLDWDELEQPGLTPQWFTLRTMPERLRARGELFRRALDDGQQLLPAIDALEELLRGR